MTAVFIFEGVIILLSPAPIKDEGALVLLELEIMDFYWDK